MKVTQFKKAPLATAISLALGLPFSGGLAMAEEIGSIEEQQVVYGIRESLKKSSDIKRSSAGVVDAISAEDIGDFPDSNLAESLQRITGVSIDRERGEGSRVTVRGFGPDFNLVLLNGRQMPTAGNYTDNPGRSFDFANLASEGVSSVRVYKSGKADVPSGGIGSTLDIRTTRPLEAPGLKATVGVSGVHDESTSSGSNVTPEISALVSNTFRDDTFGIALSAVRQERDNGANTASVGGWRTFTGDTDTSDWGGIPFNNDQVNRPTDASERFSVPQNTGYELAEWSAVRTNGQLTAQWKPIERVTTTLDYTYSELELERTFNNYSAWFNFARQETEWTDGPNASALRYSESNGGAGDFAMAAGADGTVAVNKSTGLNIVWDVSDGLSLELDYHNSSAQDAPNSPFGSASQLAIAAFSRNQTTTYFGDDLPVLELDLSDPLTADDLIVTGSVFVNEFSRMDLDQTKLSGTYEFDGDRFIDSIDFGIQLTEVNNRTASSVVQRDAWGGISQRGAIADLLTPVSSAGAFGELSGGNDPRLVTDFFSFDLPELVARTEALQASGDAVTWNTLGDCGTGLCPSSTYTTDRSTDEETASLYFQLNMSGEWFGKTVGLRVGTRYEDTDVDSRALAPNYSRLEWVGGNEFSAIPGGGDFTQLSGGYDVWLPNLDLKVDVTDDLVARASFSKTLTRPNFGDIQGGVTINQLVRVNGGTGNRGNPGLQPFESENIDLSIEYYYGEGSYISAGYFHKDVKNFIGTAQVREPLFNLPHPAQGPLFQEAVTALGGNPSTGDIRTWILANRPNAEGVDAVAGIITGVEGRDSVAQFDLTVPVNIEQATVDGWELNVQHNFGTSGFGMIANATLVDADVGFDNLNLGPQFVLNGLSDSANLVGFYDKHGIQVRVAYNWRDDFLAGTGQNNVGAGPPTYTEAYGQWDLGASYDITDEAVVYLDVINLTNETTRSYGRTELQTLFAGQTGTRYKVGVRYTF